MGSKPPASGNLRWRFLQHPRRGALRTKGTKRQFFRFVTSHVDVWYADHSTANPTGVQPDSRTRIIHGSKFKRHTLESSEARAEEEEGEAGAEALEPEVLAEAAPGVGAGPPEAGKDRDKEDTACSA